MTSVDSRLSDGVSSLEGSVGSCRIVHDIQDLAELHDPECSSVILEVPGPHDLPAEDLAVLLDRLDFPLRAEVEACGRGIDDLERPLRRIGCSPQVGRILSLWAEVLCELTGASSGGVRLARVAERMCPLFHFDRVTARLLITWHGETTELATTPNYADRIVRDPALKETGDGAGIVRPAVGDAVVMKGDLWPSLALGPAVHRSPEVPEGEFRLMCTLDPLG